MTGLLSERTRWAIVMAFAIAMAWVEAASVFYIRALVDRVEPYQADPLPMHGALGKVELWREAATLVMIATLGVLAGRTWRRRAGYAALAFGAWDIFYYVFLRLISGWPRTLLDWDILLLLPLPWWGPVLAPVSIALVMIVWGTLATQSRDPATDPRWAFFTGALGWVGIVLALALFMIDAWRALPNGRDAVLQVLPSTFNWPLFWVALLLMASPALHQIAFLPTKKSVRICNGGSRSSVLGSFIERGGERYDIVSAGDLREPAKRLDAVAGTISGTIEQNQRSGPKV
jgi:hypothetical protein